MAITTDSFQSAFPEFSDTSIATIQALITRAELRVATAAALGTTEGLRDELVGLFTAHLLTISDRSSQSVGAGAVEEIDIDDFYRVRFSRDGSGGMGIESTSYGQQYSALLNQIVIPIRIL